MHDFSLYISFLRCFFSLRKFLNSRNCLNFILGRRAYSHFALFSFIRGIAKSYGNTKCSFHRLLDNNAKLITVLSTSSRLQYRTSITFINGVLQTCYHKYIEKFNYLFIYMNKYVIVFIRTFYIVILKDFNKM